jgi:hypothetical protein
VTRSAPAVDGVEPVQGVDEKVFCGPTPAGENGLFTEETPGVCKFLGVKGNGSMPSEAFQTLDVPGLFGYNGSSLAPPADEPDGVRHGVLGTERDESAGFFIL